MMRTSSEQCRKVENGKEAGVKSEKRMEKINIHQEPQKKEDWPEATDLQTFLITSLFSLQIVGEFISVYALCSKRAFSQSLPCYSPTVAPKNYFSPTHL